jgi:hypothetical protein
MTLEKIVKTTAKPHGGKRLNSGRQKGTPNRATVTLKQVASVYTEEAIAVMVAIMRDPEVPASVRITAADKLIDRSHGKAPIHIDAVVAEVAQIDVAALNTIYERNVAKTIEMAREVKRRKDLFGLD